MLSGLGLTNKFTENFYIVIRCILPNPTPKSEITLYYAPLLTLKYLLYKHTVLIGSDVIWVNASENIVAPT